MKRGILSKAFLLTIILLLPPYVSACIPMRGVVQIDCTSKYESKDGANNVLTTSGRIYEGPGWVRYQLALKQREGDGRVWGDEYNLSMIDYLETRCKENLSAVKNQMKDLVYSYGSQVFDSTRHEEVFIQPYDQNILREVESSGYTVDDLDKCNYEEVYQLGDFIVKKYRFREYCYDTYGLFNSCSGYDKGLSVLSLDAYILRNPSKHSLKSILPWIIISVLALVVILYATVKREIGLMVKTTRNTIMLLAFFLFINLMGYFSPYYLLESTIAVYVLQYVYRKAITPRKENKSKIEQIEK